LEVDCPIFHAKAETSVSVCLSGQEEEKLYIIKQISIYFGNAFKGV